MFTDVCAKYPYVFASEITTPPATMSDPPSKTVVEGTCLKTSHESIWAITKKKTTYSPSSLPKSQGGAFTVQP